VLGSAQSLNLPRRIPPRQSLHSLRYSFFSSPQHNSNGRRYITYEHHHTPKLIVRLANGGFLYFNPSALEVDDVVNRRQKPTTLSGWKVFKTGATADDVEEELADFKGRSRWPGLEHTRFASPSFSNPTCWRIDVCFQSKEHGVGLELSFEADWPVAEENF
jgi:hypothetical protein